MADRWKGYNRQLGDPADDAYVITVGPGDLPRPIKAFRADGDGSITVRTVKGNTLPHPVKAGEVVSLRCDRVTAQVGQTIIIGYV